jgi:hypothetical protein
VKTNGADSALRRIRSGWPGARRVTDRLLRRYQGWELLLVLGIFPLGSICAAIVDLIERIQTKSPVPSHQLPGVNGQWLAAGLGIVEQFSFLAAAGMVCYLLIRSGEGVGAINLGQRRLRIDLSLLLPVFLVVQWVPQTLGTHILAWTHLQGFFLYPAAYPIQAGPLTVIQVAASVTAGIVEEVVVLGYLVRRLEQRGYDVSAVVAIAVAVRVSYHLYYGWNVVPIALWALVSVLVYLRIRRLLPFILCHIAWDVAIPVRVFYHDAYQWMMLVALISTAAMTIVWSKWNAPKSELVSSAGLDGDHSATTHEALWLRSRPS